MISFSPQRELPPACCSISSRTKSWKPRLSRRQAALSPAMPPPTMTMGVRIFFAGGGNCWRGRGDGDLIRKLSLTNDPCDAALCLGGESDQARTEKGSAIYRAMSFHSRS